ncbi:MAG: ATP synthase F0 subunit B [Candidatus Sulfobium sp.]|jgi:F-type H+-transporting ATPase subunit b
MRKVLKPEVNNEKSRRISSAILHVIPLVFIISLMFVSVAFAAEGGEAQGSVFREFVWPAVNFLVLIFVLVWLFKKMDVKGYFKKRTELIEQSLNEARQAKELAQKALAQVEERLKVKDKEIEEIIASSKISGEKEKERLIEEGEKMKERILEQAKSNIEFEVRQAKSSIRDEAVEIAMELAEKKLKEKMTKEEQMKLLEESVAKIEGKK